MSKRLPYEMTRLLEAFDRLKLLQQEITARAVKVNPEEAGLEGITLACHMVSLSGDLRQLVYRYQDLLELPKEAKDEGFLSRCVAWACAQKEGAA